MTLPNLSAYDNSWYSPGRSKVIRALWLFIGLPIFKCEFLPCSAARRFLLRCFGAEVGRGVVLRSGIRIKYPWHLSIGAFSWIGESVWIDNLVEVKIGANVCISQNAHLCTGNHDWSDPLFGLWALPIEIETGAWIGAGALICPGVTIGKCGVAAAGSVVSKAIPGFEIHSGNPAHFVRQRTFRQPSPGSPDTLEQSLARVAE